jgi:spore coat protein CotH
MRLLFLFLVCYWGVRAQHVHPANTKAFLQDEVARIDIFIEPEFLNLILGDSLQSDFEFDASFKYTANNFIDSIANIGFRVRGNTSRNAVKKSFKISFNHSVSGFKWQGIEKMNLNGQHNDVSILRTKFAQEIFKEVGLPSSRSSHVKLYINGEYKGLYVHVEQIDEEFAKKRFVQGHLGDMYKCIYGADLTFRGWEEEAYYASYEKVRNEETGYASLLDFLNFLNNSSNAHFFCEVENRFDVASYLRYLATEILTGHWDGYTFNKNNFYLIKRPADGVFMILPYDLDNTFGIDWFNIDWSERNIYEWTTSTNRPLYNRLMMSAYYRNELTKHLKNILEEHFSPSEWVTYLQQVQAMIAPAALEDTYRTGDYGFSFDDFSNAISSTFGLHVKMGIAEFLEKRVQSAYAQLQPVLELGHPCFTLDFDEPQKAPFVSEEMFDLLGRKVPENARGLIIGRNYFGQTKMFWNYE